MIVYKDIVRYDNQGFDDYLKLEGYSHSFLKRNINGVQEAITITENIRIGSLVDKILTEPESADMTDELYPYCKIIAFELKKFFGRSLTVLQSQVSYTATCEYGGFELRVKGRLDFLLEAIAVIDIKVTKSKQIDQLIEFMGYKNQLWHYCKMANVTKAYLVIYSIPLKQVIIKSVDVSESVNNFWANKIIDFGHVQAY